MLSGWLQRGRNPLTGNPLHRMGLNKGISPTTDSPMQVPSPSQLPRRSARSGRGAFARLLASLWLALYVGVVAGAPVADGFVDHDEQVVVHVEDADAGDCPASHGSEACDICQVAQGLRAMPALASAEIPVAAERGRVAPGARGVAPVELNFLDGRSSRAPPLG